MEWRPVPEYEGLYEVSSSGEVRSLDYNRTGVVKCLKPQANNCGYRQVKLKGRLFCVHKLVGAAFIPNPNALPELDHIDRDKGNNRVENLQWKTLSDNRLNVGNRPSKSGHRNVKQKSDGYEVVFQRNNAIVFDQYYKTLAAAVAARDAFLTGICPVLT